MLVEYHSLLEIVHNNLITEHLIFLLLTIDSIARETDWFLPWDASAFLSNFDDFYLVCD